MVYPLQRQLQDLSVGNSSYHMKGDGIDALVVIFSRRIEILTSGDSHSRIRRAFDHPSRRVVADSTSSNIPAIPEYQEPDSRFRVLIVSRLHNRSSDRGQASAQDP